MNSGPSLKKNRQLTNGFTLIEVLISLVILSIIAVITSSFLQSSIASKEMVFTKSSQTFQFNLLADALRDDVTNAVNIPLLDSRGEAQLETFRSSLNADSFAFITKIRSGKTFSNSLVLIEYQLRDNTFTRKQFYTPAPADQDEFSETILFDKVKNMTLQFSDGNAWFNFWPVDVITQRKIPTLIKVILDKENGETYTWIISSSLENIYD